MAKNVVIIYNQAKMLQTQEVSLRNFENQVRQLSSALNSRPQDILPSDTENPKPEGKEQHKAITLRNGMVVEDPSKESSKREPISINKA